MRIMSLCVRGLSYAEISRIIKIDHRTVSNLTRDDAHGGGVVLAARRRDWQLYRAYPALWYEVTDRSGEAC